MATVLGVIFGTILIMVSAGFLDSVNNLFQLQFEKIQAYDARISFAGPVSQSVTGNISQLNGITAVVPTLRIPADYILGDKTYTTLVVGIEPGTDLYNFYSHSGKKLQLEAGHILLTGAVKDKLGAKMGDTITLKTETGTADFIINGLVNQPMGSYGYITLPDAQKLAGGQPVITGALLDVNNLSASALRDTVAKNLGAVGVEITSELRAQMAQLMSLINVMMWVMLGFGAILALMVVFTMISVSLIERRREIATMRTLGERTGRIAAMVTIENLMLGVVGLIIGIPAGYAVTLYFMQLVQTDMFSFNLVFYVRTYILTAGVIIIVMLLSQLPGILGLNKLDLAKVTKEQVS
jgi:putative ABC transport system permease protein